MEALEQGLGQAKALGASIEVCIPRLILMFVRYLVLWSVLTSIFTQRALVDAAKALRDLGCKIACSAVSSQLRDFSCFLLNIGYPPAAPLADRDREVAWLKGEVSWLEESNKTRQD